MKTKNVLLALMILSSGLCNLHAKCHKTCDLSFCKINADKWEYVVKDPNLKPQEVFTLDNGVLKISNKVGYIRTKKAYKNFTLELEWRWNSGPANGGVLVDIQPKDIVWPVCYQAQLKANSAGDIICMDLKAKECTDTVNTTVKKMKPSNEKPVGEWNHMKVVQRKSTLRVYVNGLLQNYITGMNATEGYVGFQAEGHPMEIKLISLK